MFTLNFFWMCVSLFALWKFNEDEICGFKKTWLCHWKISVFWLFTYWNLKPAISWCMGYFKSPPRKYFLVLFWLKCIKCRHVLSPINEDFYLIIPVLLLLRTMEIICSRENSNLKSIHFVITGAHAMF